MSVFTKLPQCIYQAVYVRQALFAPSLEPPPSLARVPMATGAAASSPPVYYCLSSLL